LPLLRPSLAGASLLTFMTALASFSAPYLFGDNVNFRVMTTQILATKLNGRLEMAQAETVVLSLLALLALWAMRFTDREVSGTGVRGVAPARREIKGMLARGTAGVLGWLFTLLLLSPHAVLLLVSFVPPYTWTTQAVPPVLNLGNWKALFTEANNLRPMLNSLWMGAVSTLAALVLGITAARLAATRRGRMGT